MKRIPFTKMQGIGNDYLYVDCTKTDHFEGRGAEEFAKRFSDRHFGIGSDGVIVIRPSEKADFRMEMLNADGSQGRMCGNGIRCLTRYVIERGLTPKKEVEVETLSGIRVISTGVDEFGKFYASVNMGKPSFRTKDIPVNRASGVMINEAINAAGSSQSCMKKRGIFSTPEYFDNVLKLKGTKYWITASNQNAVYDTLKPGDVCFYHYEYIDEYGKTKYKGHAILITDIDTVNNKVWYLDQNGGQDFINKGSSWTTGSMTYDQLRGKFYVPLTASDISI